jgi:ATP-binding cassette subfamily B protein
MKVLGRVMKLLFSTYPVLIPIVAVCILFAAGVASIPSIFQQQVLKVITSYLEAGSTDWQAALGEVIPLVIILASLYLCSITLITVQTQLMAYITQGFLTKLRRKMFDGMQNLPIKYFDANKHGDIMSHYTNDIDTLRQLVSQALPSLLQACVVVLSVLFIMLWYSVWMTLVVLVGVVAMFFVTKTVGGGSAKYFIRQQKAVGKTEGYIQEMMNGQKVVKVFCHEEKTKKDFDEINDALFEDGYRAHSYANMMGPIIGNIGNIL